MLLSVGCPTANVLWSRPPASTTPQRGVVITAAEYAPRICFPAATAARLIAHSWSATQLRTREQDVADSDGRVTWSISVTAAPDELLSIDDVTASAGRGSSDTDLPDCVASARLQFARTTSPDCGGGGAVCCCVDLLLPDATLHFLPLGPLRVAASTFASSLFDACIPPYPRQGWRWGVLGMDAARRVVPLSLCDTAAHTQSLVGVWVRAGRAAQPDVRQQQQSSHCNDYTSGGVGDALLFHPMVRAAVLWYCRMVSQRRRLRAPHAPDSVLLAVFPPPRVTSGMATGGIPSYPLFVPSTTTAASAAAGSVLCYEVVVAGGSGHRGGGSTAALPVNPARVQDGWLDISVELTVHVTAPQLSAAGEGGGSVHILEARATGGSVTISPSREGGEESVIWSLEDPHPAPRQPLRLTEGGTLGEAVLPSKLVARCVPPAVQSAMRMVDDHAHGESVNRRGSAERAVSAAVALLDDWPTVQPESVVVALPEGSGGISSSDCGGDGDNNAEGKGGGRTDSSGGNSGPAWSQAAAEAAARLLEGLGRMHDSLAHQRDRLCTVDQFAPHLTTIQHSLRSQNGIPSLPSSSPPPPPPPPPRSQSSSQRALETAAEAPFIAAGAGGNAWHSTSLLAYLDPPSEATATTAPTVIPVPAAVSSSTVSGDDDGTDSTVGSCDTSGSSDDDDSAASASIGLRGRGVFWSDTGSSGSSSLAAPRRLPQLEVEAAAATLVRASEFVVPRAAHY